jgi:hypothetical protein
MRKGKQHGNPRIKDLASQRDFGLDRQEILAVGQKRTFAPSIHFSNYCAKKISTPPECASNLQPNRITEPV